MNKRYKYTIHGFQQKKLIELNLDNDDALILKLIKDCYSSTDFEYIIHNNDKYIWIYYPALLNYVPIIGSRSKLMRIIKKICDLGLIKRITRYEKDGQKGSYAYIKPTEKLDELTEYNAESKTERVCQNDTGVCQNDIEGVSFCDRGVSQNDIGGMSKWHSKDAINKNTLINNSVNKETNEKKEKALFSDDSLEIKLSKYLFEKIKRNNEKTKEPNFQSWAQHVNYLIKLDNFSEEDIIKIIDFSQDNTFWQSNILSTKKLRKNRNTLFLQVKNKNKINNNKPAQMTNYDQRPYEEAIGEDFLYDNDCFKNVRKDE